MRPDVDTTIRAAAVQLTATADKARNIATAGRLVAESARAGARLVVLPEKWNLIDVERRQVEGAEPLDGPSLAAARGWAVEHRVALVAGSVSEAIPGGSRAFNTSVLIRPDGVVAAVYRKLHLFDVEVGGHVYRESAGAEPGSEVVVGEALGRRVGLSVCYDLRFPELYRALTLRGAEILAVPAAFTATTGAAHWEPLVRARAIENQAFVVAAGQVGTHATGTASYGHSMIVDPWGAVLAEAGAGDAECVVVADLDFRELAGVRERLPALRHRRPDVYGDPGEVPCDTAAVRSRSTKRGAMSEVVVVAIFNAADGKAAEAEALLRTIIPPTHAEDGCITFALHRDLGDPGKLTLIERWASREALDRHLTADHLQAFRAVAPEVMGGPPQIIVMEALPEGDPVKGRLSPS